MSAGWTTFWRKGGNKVSRGVWRAPRGLFFYINWWVDGYRDLTEFNNRVYSLVDLWLVAYHWQFDNGC